ncbi:hypothetical protein SAMN05216227_10784 [Pseudorhodobacter antarcticus]|jgi:hypothetical protein|uniref:Uncharacterized protein n=1 Tax=Pseudorhodobacter antarcticus TaxID=1077947 RepID=A0A1H8NCD7_9RHOB|nr:hypothetical protein [Pseudorhodobacter antarcticus]SEO27361.1 hypothetical protein SAMN05216227_10784 [Pseudorhodobacter antarcticus]
MINDEIYLFEDRNKVNRKGNGRRQPETVYELSDSMLKVSDRQRDRFRVSGWWLLPSCILGTLVWLGIFSIIF